MEKSILVKRFLNFRRLQITCLSSKSKCDGGRVRHVLFANWDRSCSNAHGSNSTECGVFGFISSSWGFHIREIIDSEDLSDTGSSESSIVFGFGLGILECGRPGLSLERSLVVDIEGDAVNVDSINLGKGIDQGGNLLSLSIESSNPNSQGLRCLISNDCAFSIVILVFRVDIQRVGFISITAVSVGLQNGKCLINLSTQFLDCSS